VPLVDHGAVIGIVEQAGLKPTRRRDGEVREFLKPLARDERVIWRDTHLAGIEEFCGDEGFRSLMVSSRAADDGRRSSIARRSLSLRIFNETPPSAKNARRWFSRHSGMARREIFCGLSWFTFRMELLA
jgi:hypothetical protein